MALDVERSNFEGKIMTAPPTADRSTGREIGTETQTDMVTRLQSQIDDVLSEVIGPTRGQYCLLDFPAHGNVGDSAIWLGETRWLEKAFHRHPSYVCRYEIDLQEVEHNIQDDLIFLHGGGNFGDIWPDHQEFRESVLKLFQGRQVVQLPQTIHFKDHKNIDRMARAIADHKTYTLLVRDTESYELASTYFDCVVKLCPDMAFALGSIAKPHAAEVDVLALLRTDKEGQTFQRPRSVEDMSYIEADWLEDDQSFPLSTRITTLARALVSEGLWSRNARRRIYYQVQAEQRFKRGAELLSKGRIVISDRLHVHIMCSLLEIPHILLDNNYGKIRRLSKTFQTKTRGVRSADDLETALKTAVEFRHAFGRA